jgi:4-hydroxy-4-methyl-2-oxoglutarate aldolase
MAEKGAIPVAAMEVLEKVNTGMVVDALAMAGIQGGVVGMRPIRGFEDARVIGTATTVQYAPPSPDTPKVTMYGLVSQIPQGSVLVVDAAGQPGHFVGDNVAAYARRHGAVGAVVFGGVRDVVGLREAGLPIYSTAGLSPRQPNNMVVTAREVPVSIGGVLIRPGDIIIADEDGVVAIPAAALDAVLENMKTIFEVEESAARAIATGASAEEISAINARKKVRK